MNSQQPSVLFSLGFRPFFLLASFFSVFTILLWTIVYSFDWSVQTEFLDHTQWHAHEMIYGYAMAVVAGFLLTAVKNWTGIDTISGRPLLLLVMVWVSARLMPFIDYENSFYIMAVLDCLFFIALIIALSIPVFKVRQWKQLGVLSKILLILVSNILFYLGMAGYVPEGVRWGLYAGIYLILALVFMMARRVIPFFIEKSLGGSVRIKNSRVLDISSLIFFLVFMLADIIQPGGLLVVVMAAILLLLHSARLYGWYCNAMWQHPMLWVLYIAYIFMVLGFALKISTWYFGVSPYLSLHAFTYGGIGLMTLGMMTRVALGHTGRDVNNPPCLMPWAFFILLIGAVSRVLLPLIDLTYYSVWIFIAQICWVSAFSIFFISFLSILTRTGIHD